MSKMLVAGVSALFVTASSLAYAQTTPLGEARTDAAERVKQLLSIDWQTLTDMRIGAIKAALQFKPDQEKSWQAVEQAIRERAAARHQRLENLAARLGKPIETVDPFAVMRERADSLAERAAGLKKLASAWQPLYESLDATQKQRLRFVAQYVLHELKEAVQSRRMQSDDDEDDEIAFAVAPQTPQVRIYPIHFPTGGKELDTNDQEAIRSVAASMTANPNLHATIIGKADTVGSQEFNERLSQQRAEAVFGALVYDSHAPESRVEMRWTGERLPTVQTGAETSDVANRVVEIIVR